MEFIVIGYDGNDAEAMDRRLAVREEHLALAKSMYQEGKLLYASAILNEEEKMIGSVLIMNFPSRNELDKWLEKEPYVTGDVWRTIEVKLGKVPPMFK